MTTSIYAWFPALALVASSLSPQDPADAPPSRELARELFAEPRLAGTSGDLRGAKVVRKHLEAAGWQVEFDEREVLLSMPRRIEFSVFAEAGSDEPLAEHRARFDADAIPPGDVPLFNAWGASGKLRAPVVDVGYGLRDDFERLAAAGVKVQGAIALAKYGRAYRGVKAQLAEEFGCVAVLLYSDPKSDGGEKGPVWPEGPWKPDWDGQRGSILPVSNAPGDPTTPGWASAAPGVEGERRGREQCDEVLPKIPCIPIGVRHQRVIQARLAAGADGEPLGPGPVEVALDVDVPRELRTIRNVIATLPGETDELVIAGSHRDAWVRGANDSGSGCVGLLRAAQHLGQRANVGWKPRATIVLAFWDAEEFGLIGSTEWGEANAERLREKCLAYLNSDASVDGTRFGASGTPGMLAVVKSVAERQRTADGTASLWEDWCSRSRDGQPSLGLPGAGSDDAVFAHHLCIPVLSVGFGGNEGGQYHTSFDDFAMVDRYLDPGWVGHEMLGRLLAELLPELAARPGAGFDVAEAARAMAGRARAAADESWMGGESAGRLAAAFEASAERAAQWSWSPADRPQRFYGELASPTPLRGREWFANSLWAPALENGYGTETFPHLRYAAEAERAELVDELVTRIAGVTERLTARGLEEAGQ